MWIQDLKKLSDAEKAVFENLEKTLVEEYKWQLREKNLVDVAVAFGDVKKQSHSIWNLYETKAKVAILYVDDESSVFETLMFGKREDTKKNQHEHASILERMTSFFQKPQTSLIASVSSFRYCQLESFSFDALEEHAKKWNVQLGSQCDSHAVMSFLFLASLSHALHLALLEQDKKLCRSLEIRVETPHLQGGLEFPFIPDGFLRLKNMLLLSSSRGIQSACISYRETWISESPDALVSRIFSSIPGRLNVSESSELCALEVVVVPEQDLISCCFSLTSGKPNSVLSRIRIPRVEYYFTEVLNEYIYNTEEDKVHAIA